MILLAQGYPNQAAACSQEALARVKAEAHVHAQAKMLTTAGVVFHAMARRPEATRRYAEALGALADAHHLPAFRGWATFYRGWARAALGEQAAGLDEMVAGRAMLRGTEASLAHLLMLLAETYAQSGAVAQGCETLAEALEQVAATGARSNLAEMHRVRGELHALAGEHGAAEAQFEKAITVAEEQGAKLWALRATISLARLWQAQGRVDAARERLGAALGWFTEGLETPDLAAARALLDEMAEA
jgi:predicted ATPase